MMNEKQKLKLEESTEITVAQAWKLLDPAATFLRSREEFSFFSLGTSVFSEKKADEYLSNNRNNFDLSKVPKEILLVFHERMAIYLWDLFWRAKAGEGDEIIARLAPGAMRADAAQHLLLHVLGQRWTPPSHWDMRRHGPGQFAEYPPEHLPTADPAFQPTR